MQGKAKLDFINPGAISLSVVLLTLGVPSSIFADRLRMRRSSWFSWGTADIRYSFIFSPNHLAASTTDKMMLNLSCTRCRISPQMNAVILGVHVYAWGPFAVARSREPIIHAGTVCNGMPSSTYFRIRGSSGCWTAPGRVPSVLRCLESMKALREWACFRASNISCAVTAMLSTLGSPRGG